MPHGAWRVYRLRCLLQVKRLLSSVVAPAVSAGRRGDHALIACGRVGFHAHKLGSDILMA